MALSAELVGFVKESLRSGLARAQIEQTLLSAGWPADQVKQALRGFADLEFPIPVPRPHSYTSSRETFMYVLMFATLFLSAYSLGVLIFELIDRAYPDAAARVYRQPNLEAVRWSLSSLIVAFPVFLYMARTIRRAIDRDPIKRASKVRRQLTYVTLFVAAAVLIGDIITTIYNFLGGELTMRFVLKVLTVAVIAGVVFGYYLWDLRADESEPET